MKIYGEKNIKRCIKVGEINYNDLNDKGSAIGFIKEHNMLAEFFAEMNDDIEEDMNLDISSSTLKSVEYNGNTYWYGENSYDVLMCTKLYRKIGIYKQLPDIYDDSIFHWKRNKKYGSMECVIEEGVFEYQCIYKTDGNAVINVRYTACDNLHHNKVTIATIEVEYATNIVILKGIKQWKRNFKDELAKA